MTKEEYTHVIQQAFLLGALARSLDVGDAINAINRGESVGPLLDPTLYRVVEKRLDITKRVLEGLAKFQASLPTLEEAQAADLRVENMKEMLGWK